jgi:hypothetical protein
MSLQELQEELAEILERPAKGNFPPEQTEALNLLNAYRFLCGVEPEVTLDRSMFEGAMKAAAACQKFGGLSHDLGEHTESCNLHQNSGTSTIAWSVAGYIEDNGANNRDARGHRRWCLNPPMEETGFGISEDKRYFAMWAHDSSGKAKRDFWAYPGPGLFPLDYLHGNGWSLYLTETAPPSENVKVEVYLLDERPVERFKSNEEIPGKALPVPFVSTTLNSIQFEPTGDEVTESGIYFVRVSGDGVDVEYLVELFDPDQQ